MGHKKTKPCTGLTVSRSGDYFICSWAQGEQGIDKQEMLIGINGYAISWPVTKSDTASAVPLNGWGGPIMYFNFAVREKDSANSTTWSDWAGSPIYYMAAAHAPKITHTLNNDTKSTFHVEVPSSDTDNAPTSGFMYQTVLAKDGNADWSKATGGTVSALTGDFPYEETNFGDGDYCYVRWFRACGVGYAGNSGWVYDKHVYAHPNQARNTKATYKDLPNSGSQISVNWQSDVSAYRPIDSIIVRYQATAPVVTFSESGNKMTMSIAAPNTDSGWTDLQTTGGSGGSRSMSRTIATKLTTDQCAVVRVDHKHDNLETPGVPVIADNGLGSLALPAFNGSITPGGEGMERLYTIPVARNTTIDNAAIAIHFRTDKNQSRNDIIGIIPPKGSSYYTGDTIQVWIPELDTGESPSFGVEAFIGDYTPITPTSSTEPTYYSVTNIKMQSGINWTGGVVPLPPTLVITQLSSDTVQASWNWSWTDANNAELSWADHEDAWYSTSEPTKYTVPSNNVSRWNITGLSLDKWYFRIRLLKVVQDVTTYGTYSNTKSTTLSSSPNIPRLLLQPTVITNTGTTTGTWAYESTDGTSQMYASIYEAFYNYEEVENPSGSPIENGYYELVDDQYIRSLDTEVDPNKTYYVQTGGITYSSGPIQTTGTSQHVDIRAEEQGWQPGETHYLALQLISSAGVPTDAMSAPVPITIADALVPEITQHSFVDVSETSDPDWVLDELPLTVTTTGGGTGGTTVYTIERDEDYVIRRPDDSDYYGFKGETVVLMSPITGEGQVTIERSDVIGTLDDNARYRLISTVTDSFGQVESVSIPFRVSWAHQAVIPSATLSIDEDAGVTFITPIKPTEWEAGDVADIYRLSADAPELIVESAEFGTKYVDPYPAYGEFGGYRIVYRTANGDYISNRVLAMTDYLADDPELDIKHDKFGIVIDFNGEQLVLPYNVSLSNSWNKDFIKTVYLGGTIQGDWNPAVERSSSANTTIPIEVEPEQIETVRRLANYAGVCHIRTPDGSSFNADIQVKDDREEKWVKRISKVSLTITKVDRINPDGMTYDQWIERQTPELDEP